MKYLSIVLVMIITQGCSIYSKDSHNDNSNIDTTINNYNGENNTTEDGNTTEDSNATNDNNSTISKDSNGLILGTPTYKGTSRGEAKYKVLDGYSVLQVSYSCLRPETNVQGYGKGAEEQTRTKIGTYFIAEYIGDKNALWTAKAIFPNITINLPVSKM